MSRYLDNDKLINNHPMYDKILEKRGLKQITQHESKRSFNITEEDIQFINTVEYVWDKGMTYRYLAHQYYNSPNHWWVIAMVNKRPTEAHLRSGDTILIPLDLSEVLGLMTDE